MDRTPEEKIAVMLATAALLKQGVLVAEPHFDREGGDLLGLTAAGEQAAICRIQVKYRNTTGKNVNEVVIPQGYVEGAFVLFLNLKTKQGEPMLCLLPDKIKHYATAGELKEKKVYRLRLTEETVSTLAADAELEFNAVTAEAIKTLAQKSSAASAVYQEFLGVAQQAGELLEKQAELIKLQEIMHKINLARQGVQITGEVMDGLSKILSVLEKQKRNNAQGDG